MTSLQYSSWLHFLFSSFVLSWVVPTICDSFTLLFMCKTIFRVKNTHIFLNSFLSKDYSFFYYNTLPMCYSRTGICKIESYLTMVPVERHEYYKVF